MQKNYHIILGITADASASDIKTAFRRRTMEPPPDRSGLTSRPFQDAQEAYHVLGDPERQRHYDQKHRAFSSQAPPPGPGSEPFGRECPKGEPLRPGQPGRNFREISPLESFETYTPSFDELFDRFWSNFVPFNRPKAERLESLTVEVVLGPEEAEFGSRLRVWIPAKTKCAECGGHGTVAFYECCRCEGHGVLITDCPMELLVPPGTRDGDVLRIPLKKFGVENFYLTLLFRIGALGD